MKVRSIITVCFFVVCSFVLRTYDAAIKVTFPEKDCSIKTDGFGNIYVINNDEITKYNSGGIAQKKFSNKRYGKIEYMDATNPLKVLVYYKDFQQLLFLDNQMTPASNVISLETIGYEQTGLVCSSANNSFWLFDKQNNEVIRFNDELKPVVKTGNLKRILDIDIKPNFIKEQNSNLYLNSPQEGILVFDIYGTFIKTIPLKGLKEFDVVNGNIFYFENGALKEYQSQTFNTIEKQFNDALLKTVYWQNNKFYKVYSDSLLVQ